MDSLNDRNQGLCLHAEAVMPLIRERLAAGQNVKNLGFQGVSMMPMLRQGKDSVELAPLPQKLRKYDLPVYRNAAGKYVIHRIVDVRGGRYICRGDNTYHDENIAPEQMVAVVCAFTRAGKRISVQDWRYQCYCRVWCAVYPLRRLVKHAEWRAKSAVRKLVKGRLK